MRLQLTRAFLQLQKKYGVTRFSPSTFIAFSLGGKNTQVGSSSLKNYPSCCNMREIHKFILLLILASISTLRRAVKNFRPNLNCTLTKFVPRKLFVTLHKCSACYIERNIFLLSETRYFKV